MEPVSLEAMDSVQLMNRYDSKYRLTVKKLALILDAVDENYFVLEIDGKRVQEYNTIYYNTPDDYFYITHHNGKLERIKIRKREYVDSGITFIEIKKKNNKKKTEKFRTRIEKLNPVLSQDETDFLKKHLRNHIQINNLETKSINTFRRITLVNKDFSERCTIDLNLTFISNGKECSVQNMAVVELKQACIHQKSPFSTELKKNHIYSTGFSKYCIGRAILNSLLKRNLFKSSILELHNNSYNIALKNQESKNYQPIY